MRANPSGAVELGEAIGREADVVVLTNLQDHFNEARTAQLLSHGLNLKVFTNQGPKGPALQNILAEYRPSRALFIDDSPKNVEGARAIGMQALHFRSADALQDDLRALGLVA